jgi:hypothetical protein
VSLLSIVTLRQAGAGAGALVTGQALAAQYYWMFLFGQSFIPAVNAVLLAQYYTSHAWCRELYLC